MRVLYCSFRRCSSALGRFQFGLLVGDQQAVLLHLLVQVVDGRLRHADLLVDIGFLIDERLRFGLVFLDFCLKRFALLFELCLLIAEAGELFLISELDAALTMIMRALETRPSSITAANTKQTIRRAEPLFFCFISKRYLPVLHLQELPDGQQAAEHAHEEARDRVGGCDDLNDVRERS